MSAVTRSVIHTVEYLGSTLYPKRADRTFLAPLYLVCQCRRFLIHCRRAVRKALFMNAGWRVPDMIESGASPALAEAKVRRRAAPAD